MAHSASVSALPPTLIPQPRAVQWHEGWCRLLPRVRLVATSQAGAWGAELLASWVARLKARLGVVVDVADAGAGEGLVLHLDHEAGLAREGYRLRVEPEAVWVAAADAAGAYYALQTLAQCFVEVGPGQGHAARCGLIEDQPALRYRAVHYDTKHHQPTADYVYRFIEELAHYKINTLVWEWEDKFAYRHQPYLGAPGAFTADQMRQFTEHARKHHMQLVPLVQGLGHVSFLLKHPQLAHLREIADSNWELCPLREETYALLFALWDEAIDATPGVEFLHIGSDETYELGRGEGCGCKAKAAQIGTNGLMQIFLHRCADYVRGKGRRMLSWGGAWQGGQHPPPPRDMIYVDSEDVSYLQAAQSAGYSGWVYAPNPGIMPLFLPHEPVRIQTMWQEGRREDHPGVFAATGQTIAAAARAQVVDGSITTSWDDSGLHNQCWMPRFVCAAEFSWNPAERDIDQWAQAFFGEYFGPRACDMREIFIALRDGALFYDDTFERRVWHWGDIGKMHLPDFPRGDLELSDFWRRRYRDILAVVPRQIAMLEEALDRLDRNIAAGVRHVYDLRVYRTCAALMKHNAELIRMLGDLETELFRAHNLHYTNRRQAAEHLDRAAGMIAHHLHERSVIYEDLVSVWEETRLPKGLSLPQQPYVFARDRARHFANRTPDMSYLILDEQKLDLEGYLERLRAYTQAYRRDNGLAASDR